MLWSAPSSAVKLDNFFTLVSKVLRALQNLLASAGGDSKGRRVKFRMRSVPRNGGCPVRERRDRVQVQPNKFDRLWADCGTAVHSALERVGASGWCILGKEVAAFEAAMADWAEVPHVVGVANGMDALEIALRIAGISKGEKVLTTALSAFPTALSVLRAGAVPVFADTGRHGLLDPEAAAAAFVEHPDIRAIAPVHLYGNLADMQTLQRLADAHGAHGFEDAGQTIGTAYKQTFRLVIAQRLSLEPRRAAYFDGWGSQIYTFVPNGFNDTNINWAQAAELLATHVISDRTLTDVELVDVTPDGATELYLYRID